MRICLTPRMVDSATMRTMVAAQMTTVAVERKTILREPERRGRMTKVPMTLLAAVAVAVAAVAVAAVESVI